MRHKSRFDRSKGEKDKNPARNYCFSVTSLGRYSREAERVWGSWDGLGAQCATVYHSLDFKRQETTEGWNNYKWQFTHIVGFDYMHPLV